MFSGPHYNLSWLVRCCGEQASGRQLRQKDGEVTEQQNRVAALQEEINKLRRQLDTTQVSRNRIH